MNQKRLKKQLYWAVASLVVGMNIIACFHAYKFTHFTTDRARKTQSPDKLTAFDKVKTLLLGVSNPRPENLKTPVQVFETIHVRSNKSLECWYIKNDTSRGTVILFHGYSASKSSLIDKSDEFLKLGYSTLLVDFMGSGGSEGNQTTLGFKEAEEVKSAIDYIVAKGEKRVYLFGTSMGAVAILKAINDYQLAPAGIIIECPFGSMYQTTCARFRLMNAPTFPMAGLLLFWGGVQNGFWAYGHKPSNYAKNVRCPTLLLAGKKDKNVSQQEIADIYANLQGEKTQQVFEHSGHENYLIHDKSVWLQAVTSFLHP
jgi:uncharacterized protein